MATIRDVARHAQVHPSTVSRVFSGKATISEPTRKRVLEAASLLGFQPNAIARSLRIQRTHTIGIVVPYIYEGFFNDHFFPQIMRGMLTETYQHHFRLIVGGSQGYEDEISQIWEIIQSSQADGIVVMSSRMDVDTVDQLHELKTPFVLIGHPPSPDHNHIFWTDGENQQSTSQAIEHLISLGHRRIAYVGGDPKTFTTRERQQAYESSLKKAGITPLKEWVDYGYFDEPGGYTAVQRMVVLGDKAPTAYYAANDLMAIGILRALDELGLNVPRDISVVGTNNSLLALHSRPPLTTIDVSYSRIAQNAIDMIITQITESHPKPTSMVEPCPLIIRNSTAPAKGFKGYAYV